MNQANLRTIERAVKMLSQRANLAVTTNRYSLLIEKFCSELASHVGVEYIPEYCEWLDDESVLVESFHSDWGGESTFCILTYNPPCLREEGFVIGEERFTIGYVPFSLVSKLVKRIEPFVKIPEKRLIYVIVPNRLVGWGEDHSPIFNNEDHVFMYRDGALSVSYGEQEVDV